MGTFDSIYIPCPKCGTNVEVQSKAAPKGPSMTTFPVDEIPARVAADIQGDDAFCVGCETIWKVYIKKLRPVYRARLVSKDEFEKEDEE